MKVVVGASSFAGSSDKAINLLLEKGIEHKVVYYYQNK